MYRYRYMDRDTNTRRRERPILVYLLVMIAMNLAFFYFADSAKIDALDYAMTIAIGVPLTAAILTGFYYFVRYQLEHN